MTESSASKPGGAGLSARWSSDERLARRASRGDRRAFEAIYKRYHQDLYRFCLTIVGIPQDAEDALQSTMVKALRTLPGEERQIRLRPWLYRVARNEAIDTLRGRREEPGIEPEMLAGGSQIAQAVEAREHLRRLIGDLAALPERQRAALTMRELGGLGFTEIGEAFETSPAVARQTVYEARVSLRQMEAGREMRCGEVTEHLSDADGRILRRRDIQAHLRHCRECQSFQDAIVRRRGELKAIAPLPLTASAAVLQGALGATQGAVGGAGLAGAAGVGAGKAAGVSVLAKSAATVAVVAAVGVGAADRSGLVDAPLVPSGSGQEASTTPGGPDPSANPTVPATDDKLQGGESAAGIERAQAQGSPGDGSGVAGEPNEAGGPPASAAPSPSGPLPAHGKSAAAHGGAKAKGHAKAKGSGKPTGHPAASAHGQQRAAERKSPQGNPSPGDAPPKSAGAQTSPRPRPERPPKESGVPPAPTPEPETSAPSQETADSPAGKPAADAEP